MSFKGLTKKSTYKSAAPTERNMPDAGRSVTTKFGDAAPRDRVALQVYNVPGLKNRQDDFQIRAWKNGRSGGIAVSVNCLTMTAAEAKGTPGREAVEQFAKAAAAVKASEAASSDAEIGRAVRAINADYATQAARNEQLARLADKIGATAPKGLVDHLHASLTTAIQLVESLLAPLPAGV